MIICVKPPNEKTPDLLSPNYVTDYNNNCDGAKMIMITKWAMKEMNVPAYPEKMMYRKIKKYFDQNYSPF